MVLGRRFEWVKDFDGMPKKSDFVLRSEELGQLEDGDIIFESEFLSVEFYQRAYIRKLTPPQTMIGSTVAKVIESKNEDYPVGTRIVLDQGWVAVGKTNPRNKGTEMYKAPDIGSWSSSLLLGAVGMPGNTAYFGFLELCQPKAGETVVVNCAAGGTGNLVGQIAKIKGCKVIAFASGEEKVCWLKEDLGFDHVFDYTKTTYLESLKIAAPNGVDCLFDNVGGDNSTYVLKHMNSRGRIVVSFSDSMYMNEAPKTEAIQVLMVFKQLRMEGFEVSRWRDRFPEGMSQMAQWIKEGKIKVKETFVDGFENTPEAFIGLMEGKNIGKMLVKI